MHLPPLLLTLLSSLALTRANPYADAYDVYARAANPHHEPKHDLQARHAYHANLYARNLQIKALHKRLWYAPICDVPPSPPESPRAWGGEDAQTP